MAWRTTHLGNGNHTKSELGLISRLDRERFYRRTPQPNPAAPDVSQQARDQFLASPEGQALLQNAKQFFKLK